MAKLRADKRNYKKAFTVHANSYDNWNIGSPYSRRLLLCYCVECGLKYLIMKDNRIYEIKQANEELKKVLTSHNFKELLKAVRRAGIYHFNNFMTEYGETVIPSEYHQVCRYCILPKVKNDLEEFNKTLEEIKDWIGEVI